MKKIIIVAFAVLATSIASSSTQTKNTAVKNITTVLADKSELGQAD